MAKTNTLRVAAPAPPRSRERENLRQAIERRTQAEQRVADVRAAEQRRAGAYHAACRARDAAEAALAEAKDPQRTVAALLGEADAGSPLQEAEAALAAAEAEVARWGWDSRTRALLVEAERDAASAIEVARLAVARCVRDVVRSEPPRKLAEECLALRRAFTDKIRALDFLASRGMLADELQHFRAIGDWPDLPGSRPFEEWIAALEGDPDAAGPE